MKGTLEQWLPKQEAEKPKEERCSKCHAIIKGIKYTLTEKGKAAVYCQPCAKAKLRPHETADQL